MPDERKALRSLLRAARAGQPPASADLARLLLRHGELLRQAGDPQGGRAAYQGAAALGLEGPSQLGLGLCALAMGDVAQARSAFHQARSSPEAAQDPSLAAVALGNLAALELGEGRAEQAAEGFERALDSLEAADKDDPWLRCNAARAQAALGRQEHALERCRAAVAAARQAQDPLAEGLAWALEGDLRQLAGQLEVAGEALVAAEEAYGRAGNPQGRLRIQVALGGLRYQQGRLDEAEGLWSAALPAARTWSAPGERIKLLVNLGGLHHQRCDSAAALSVLDEALACWPAALSAPLLRTRLRANRGLALLGLGRCHEARDDLVRARDGYRAAGDARGLLHQLTALSNLHRYQGDLEGAIAYQRELSELERAHGLRAEEPGGLLYSTLGDRSLNVFRDGRPLTGQPGRGLEQGATGRGLGPVLLLAPPAYGAYGALFPRGLVAVGSFLEQHGVPTKVLPLAHFVDDYEGASRVRQRTRALLADALGELKPRMVGISAGFTYLYPRALELVRMLRELDERVPVVLGGSHVTFWDRECLAEAPGVDAVVRGEGEWTALELVRCLERGGDLGALKGLTWRDEEGELHRNPARPLGDLGELPDIDFSLLPRRFCQGMEISAITSRGCAYRCRFCHERRLWGGVVRHHPVARVLGEMERMGRDYGNPLRGVDDSMLSMDQPYFYELMEGLGRCRHRLPNFGLLTRLDTICTDGLRAMKRAGLGWLSVGAESGSPRVLEAMNKGITPELALRSLSLARDAQVSATVYFIVGHPGDDPQQSSITHDFADRLFREGLCGWLDLSIFTPYPGTAFFRHPERHGVEILTRDWTLWRRSNRPVAQLRDYRASEIYLSYLQLLALQDRHLAPKRSRAH